MLPSSWELPEAIRKRFGRKLGRQRAMYAEGHLLLILHKLPEQDSQTREGTLYWLKPDGEWKTNQRGAGLGTLKEHIAAYEGAVEAIESDYQQAALSKDYFHVLERIVPIERAAQNQLDALQSAREAVRENTDIISLRDRAAEITRTAEILQADARHGLEFAMARQAEAQAQIGHEMAQAGHRLNLIAAVFFPLTALGSMLGMNMKTGLEDTPVWLFWVVFIVALLLGGALGRTLAGGSRSQ